MDDSNDNQPNVLTLKKGINFNQHPFSSDNSCSFSINMISDESDFPKRRFGLKENVIVSDIKKRFFSRTASDGSLYVLGSDTSGKNKIFKINPDTYAVSSQNIPFTTAIQTAKFKIIENFPQTPSANNIFFYGKINDTFFNYKSSLSAGTLQAISNNNILTTNQILPSGTINIVDTTIFNNILFVIAFDSRLSKYLVLYSSSANSPSLNNFVLFDRFKLTAIFQSGERIFVASEDRIHFISFKDNTNLSGINVGVFSGNFGITNAYLYQLIGGFCYACGKQSYYEMNLTNNSVLNNSGLEQQETYDDTVCRIIDEEISLIFNEIYNDISYYSFSISTIYFSCRMINKPIIKVLYTFYLRQQPSLGGFQDFYNLISKQNRFVFSFNIITRAWNLHYYDFDIKNITNFQFIDAEYKVKDLFLSEQKFLSSSRIYNKDSDKDFPIIFTISKAGDKFFNGYLSYFERASIMCERKESDIVVGNIVKMFYIPFACNNSFPLLTENSIDEQKLQEISIPFDSLYCVKLCHSFSTLLPSYVLFFPSNMFRSTLGIVVNLRNTAMRTY